MNRIKAWLSGLSFRTGVIVLLMCVPFFILSFAQMALPISVEAKGVIWLSSSDWQRPANMVVSPFLAWKACDG